MVVSELYLRILSGDTKAIGEALKHASSDPIFNSIITDGVRAYQIATEPKFKKVRNALIKLQRLGVYANLDTLGGEAAKVIFSTTTELESEDIEKLFISYLEEEDAKAAKEVNEDSGSVVDKVKDFYKSYHGPKRDHAEREAKENVIKSTSEISGFYKGLLTAAGTAAAIFGGVLLWKKFNNDDDSDIVIISGD